MYKVLIFENQYEQFKEIRKYLSEKFEVHPQVSVNPPDVTAYKRVIDPVRIFLNNRFSADKTRRAGDAIAKYINRIDPDVLIIDHVLVGYYTAKTGIDLARFTRTDPRIDDLNKPILFLSRTPSNSVKVIPYIVKVGQPLFWIGKGYNGSKVLDKNFLADEVIPQIEDLIKKGRSERVNIALSSIIADINELTDVDTTFIDEPEIKSKLRQLSNENADFIFQFQQQMLEPHEEDMEAFIKELKKRLNE